MGCHIMWRVGMKEIYADYVSGEYIDDRAKKRIIEIFEKAKSFSWFSNVQRAINDCEVMSITNVNRLSDDDERIRRMLIFYDEWPPSVGSNFNSLKIHQTWFMPLLVGMAVEMLVKSLDRIYAIDFTSHLGRNVCFYAGEGGSNFYGKNGPSFLATYWPHELQDMTTV